MPNLSSIVQFLDSFLENGRFRDSSLNGLQVEASTEVRRVGYAVDAGLSIFEKAAALEVDLLVVHHGLFWGDKPYPLKGPLGKKVELLYKKRISLYASHLPLDAHPEVGNGHCLARFLRLDDIQPFFEYGGAPVGAKGRARKDSTLASFIDRLKELPGVVGPMVLSSGGNKITTVGVVTGSGSSAITTCAESGIDLLVSGEPKHEAYHLAKELGVNAIFAGHYATETFGVTALAKRLERDFDLEAIFIDENSGI